MMERRYQTPRRAYVVLILLLVVETGWLAYPFVRDFVFPTQESTAERGRRLAAELGCFSCHGSEGRGGVPNPGSKWDEVPSFHEGTPMMFAGSDNDLREYILDGAPAAKLARESYRTEMDAQAIRMPAFRDWLDEEDVDALVTFIRAVSGLARAPEGAAARGAELAAANGCFSCHGVMGTGGMRNPGSLKGYVPGFSGPDFNELVRDDLELRQWITQGTTERFADNPAARYFLDRQRVQMPAYGAFLEEGQIDDLVAYVRWLATGDWERQEIFD